MQDAAREHKSARSSPVYGPDLASFQKTVLNNGQSSAAFPKGAAGRPYSLKGDLE